MFFTECTIFSKHSLSIEIYRHSKNLHSRLYIWNYNHFKIDHSRIYKYSLGQCPIFFSSFDEKNSNQTWLWIKSMTQLPRLYCSDLYSELSFQKLYRHNTYSVISSSDLLYLSRIKSTLSKGVWLVPQTLKKSCFTQILFQLPKWQ